MNDTTIPDTAAGESLEAEKTCGKNEMSTRRLTDAFHKLRAQFDELQESTRTRARDAARTADEAVHHHPYSAIGIAAAAGLIIGLLAARR